MGSNLNVLGISLPHSNMLVDTFSGRLGYHSVQLGVRLLACASN
jgi:hypothetical protein